MITNILCYTVAGLGILALYLNVKKNYISWVIWIVVDLFWMLRNLIIGEHAQSILYFVYFLFAVYGIYAWKIKRESK